MYPLHLLCPILVFLIIYNSDITVDSYIWQLFAFIFFTCCKQGIVPHQDRAYTDMFSEALGAAYSIGVMVVIGRRHVSCGGASHRSHESLIE